MNKEKLTEALRELSAISGFRVSLLALDMREIAAYPQENHLFCAYVGLHSKREAEECRACRRDLAERAEAVGHAVSLKCRHGLIEVISPLYNYGVLSGYLSMAEARPESESTERMTMALAHLGKREADARAMAAAMPTLPDARIGSLIRVIAMCAEHLSLSASIEEAKPSISVLTRRYVDENYKKHIGIKDICDAVGYSKSTVLNAFKKDSGLTVGAYLCSVRLDAAAQLLRSSSLTVAEVAREAGFSDQSYFSKVFSAKFRKTPTEYRKELKK